MKALQKNAPFGENTYGIQKSYKVHKHRIKNMRKCIDNETPRSFVGNTGPRSPNRRIIAKQMAEESLRKDNFLLARRIYQIMQGESEISQTINHNDHIVNHPGTMNFRRRLEEAQRIHHKNLMFAIRMQQIQPYYRRGDLTVVRTSKDRSASPDSKSHKKNKFMKEFEYSLQLAEEQTSSLESNGGFGYRGFMDESTDSANPNRDGQTRPRTILLQYTKAQDNRILDVVVLKEPFRDRYAIFGLDVDDGQRYELRLTSEDVSNILDGDILVTSVDNVEVWMALLNKVRLKPVPNFNQLPFTNQEIDVLSANGLAFDFPVSMHHSANSVDPGALSTRSMASTPNNDGGERGGEADEEDIALGADRLPSAGLRPQSRAPQSRGGHMASGSNTTDGGLALDLLLLQSQQQREGGGGEEAHVLQASILPPFEYGRRENEEDDVPLSSRTELSASSARPLLQQQQQQQEEEEAQYNPNHNHHAAVRPSTSSRTASANSRPNTNPRTATRHSPPTAHVQQTLPAIAVFQDLLESDAETAEMIRASNVAAALSEEQQQQQQQQQKQQKKQATAVEDVPLVPKQPTSRPSSKPASIRANSARMTSSAATAAATVTAGDGAAAESSAQETSAAAAAGSSSSSKTPQQGLRPVPPSKPKTPSFSQPPSQKQQNSDPANHNNDNNNNNTVISSDGRSTRTNGTNASNQQAKNTTAGNTAAASSAASGGNTRRLSNISKRPSMNAQPPTSTSQKQQQNNSNNKNNGGNSGNGSGHKNYISSATKRPEEKKQMAQSAEAADQLTQERLAGSSAAKEERAADEVGVVDGEKEKEEEETMVKIVTNVASSAVIQAVSSVSDNLKAASAGSSHNNNSSSSSSSQPGPHEPQPFATTSDAITDTTSAVSAVSAGAGVVTIADDSSLRLDESHDLSVAEVSQSSAVAAFQSPTVPVGAALLKKADSTSMMDYDESFETVDQSSASVENPALSPVKQRKPENVLSVSEEVIDESIV